MNRQYIMIGGPRHGDEIQLSDTTRVINVGVYPDPATVTPLTDRDEQPWGINPVVHTYEVRAMVFELHGVRMSADFLIWAENRVPTMAAISEAITWAYVSRNGRAAS